MCHGTLLMQISYQTLKAFELGHLEYFITMKINAFSHCLIRVTLYATLSNKKQSIIISILRHIFQIYMCIKRVLSWLAF